MRKKKKKKGFTLIEAVAGLAMFAIVSTVIMNMIMGVNKHNAMNKNQVDTHAISRAFNEAIKTARPVTIKDKLTDWEETDEAEGKNAKYYFIGINNVDDLSKVVIKKFLNKDDTGVNGINYKLQEVTELDEIEALCNNLGQDFEYGIKVKVQKKKIEKVYLFETITMGVKEGIITATDRQFAISSEV
ncbi:MAG: pilus assembly FimT family protein [Clostridium sp.]